MSAMNRRDAVKLTAGWTAGLAIGAGGFSVREARGQLAGPAAEPQPVDALTHPQPAVAAAQREQAADPQLELALKEPQRFMFSEQVTFKLAVDGHSRDLFITSARDPSGLSDSVRVPPGSMRIFRADADRDEFTKQGGIYWRFFETEGKVQFKRPGPLVMIVRDRDDTVRCYALVFDFRC